DGYSQPGAAEATATANATLRIELDGSLCTPPPDNPTAWDDCVGLTIGSEGAITVRGLVINRFASDGIRLDHLSDGCVIAGNYIGTDVAGTSALGNGGSGVAGLT